MVAELEQDTQKTNILGQNVTGGNPNLAEKAKEMYEEKKKEKRTRRYNYWKKC